MTKKNVKLYIEEYLSKPCEHIPGEEVLIFTTDPWNDYYSYKTLFHANFKDADGSLCYIGKVKIFTSQGNITSDKIKVNDYFNELDDTFYSLGQSEDYYIRLKTYLGDSYEDVLNRIRDIAINQKKLKSIKEKYQLPYYNSLIRESTASSALNIISERENTYHSFIFENIVDDIVTQRCKFNFSENKYLPYRINAIIGKNSAGKTRYISDLARYLNSRDDKTEECYKIYPLEDKYLKSIDEKDFLEFLGFNNYITVSFNAFDYFYQPMQNEIDVFIELVEQLRYYFTSKENKMEELFNKFKKDNSHNDESDKAIDRYKEYMDIGHSLKEINSSFENYLSSDISSYKYIGLRKNNIINTDYHLHTEMLNALRMIYMYDYYHINDNDIVFKQDSLDEFISKVLFYGKKTEADSFCDNVKSILKHIENEYGVNSDKVSFTKESINKLESIIETMSSGQNITFYIYLNIIANITKSSLILIDEPETHLHPNAISCSIRFLYELLEQYSSYSIITTHSPLVIQEIPASCIKIFKNIDGKHYTENITMETFGSNISDIINNVFFVDENESNYKKYLIKLCDSGMEYDEILNLFQNNLNLDAKLFLKSYYKKFGDLSD